MQEIRISFDEDDFRKLIAGEIVESRDATTKVKILLKDIGYDRMIALLEEEMEGKLIRHRGFKKVKALIEKHKDVFKRLANT